MLLVAVAMMARVPSFTNPILPYDYSDPDVIRVGSQYLMTASSFNNVPGLQIVASADLVHWEIVDAAIRDRLPGYREGDPVLGNFVWAPSIRLHDDRLWIYYGDPDRGIYCVRSKPINSSTHQPINFPLEWEAPVLVMAGRGLIDPCPFWDEDGRVWLVHALAGSRAGLKSVLLMAELEADGLSVRTPSRIIFDGHDEHPTCEGPKLYKRNGYYYIMHPAGGVRTGWQVVQRSRTIYGPYELRITLAQGRTAVNGPHQGAWVDTPDGEDWFVHFQDVGVAGRIVHLQPLRWVDDWPVMGNDGEPIASYSQQSVVESQQSVESQKVPSGTPINVESQKSKVESQKVPSGTPINVESDQRLTTNDKRPTTNDKRQTTNDKRLTTNDQFTSSTLSLSWQWAGGYVDPRWYFCDAANGLLRLFSAPRGEDDFMPNMLLQKIPATAFTATARVRFRPSTHPKMSGAEEAGMILFGRKTFRLPVSATEEWTYLRLCMDERQQGRFYTSADGENWTPVGKLFQAEAGYWTGAQVGLYCTRDRREFNDAGWLDVDWFEMQIP